MSEVSPLARPRRMSRLVRRIPKLAEDDGATLVDLRRMA
jgi:hypothetical protein